jgi:hypothetical protein
LYRSLPGSPPGPSGLNQAPGTAAGERQSEPTVIKYTTPEAAKAKTHVLELMQVEAIDLTQKQNLRLNATERYKGR